MLNIKPHLAYGPERHAVETVMRMQAVKRWHMIDTTRTQTLAEHSANVAMLAMLVAMNCPMFQFGPPAYIAMAALVHDMPEAFTGDIPTHTKKYLVGLNDLEDAVTHPNFSMKLTENVTALIKICDLVDGIRFIRLHGVDMTARHAREGIEAQLEKKFLEVKEMGWADGVIQTVRRYVMFYAYENS